MSSICSLVARRCPEGVAFKTLGSVTEIVSGATPAKSKSEYWDNGTIPWLSSGEVNKGTIYDAETKISQSGYDSCSTKMVPARTVVMALAGQGKTRGMVARTRLACCTNQSLASIVPCVEVDSDYLYHFLKTQYQRLREVSSGDGTRGGLNLSMIREFKIPVPPLAIQREIALVLDQMESVKAELEAELDLRSRQYAFYRDSLLDFDSTNCKWLTLSEVAAEFGRGKSKHRPRNDPRLYGGPYPFIQTGDVRNSGHLITEYSQTYNEEGLAQSKLWPRGTVCITIAANIAETGILDFEACFPDSVVGLVVDPDKTSQGYVEYLLQTFKSNLVSRGQGSAQENINLATFANERLPFPPLKEQELVVAILDKFDSLVNDLSVGLPAEIAARRQQYEYNRDRLLTFDEVVA